MKLRGIVPLLATLLRGRQVHREIVLSPGNYLYRSRLTIDSFGDALFALPLVVKRHPPPFSVHPFLSDAIIVLMQRASEFLREVAA